MHWSQGSSREREGEGPPPTRGVLSSDYKKKRGRSGILWSQHSAETNLDTVSDEEETLSKSVHQYLPTTHTEHR